MAALSGGHFHFCGASEPRVRISQKLYNRSVYLLYSLLFFVALIISTPWWLLQMWRLGKYRQGWSERLGRVPARLLQRGSEDTIWIHAVSVGEVLAVSRLIDELKRQLPNWRFVVSTTTDTGQKLARQRFGEQNVFYLPLDLPIAVRPYFEALRPKLLLLAESEFWPNLLRWAKLSGAAVAVVNARISDRSFPGYFRFRRLLRPMMNNIDLFLAQSEEDARRLTTIGAPAERVHVSGNLKFEVKPPAKSPIVPAFLQAIRTKSIGPVIVAGSTVAGEEYPLLSVYKQIQSRYRSALLVLAPRHPERFDHVAEAITSSGMRYERRSHWEDTTVLEPGVFLLDTIGELAAMYEVADLAFIGEGLVPAGGHNVLEAAQFGKAILVGPSTENFRDIVEIFRHADAIRVLPTEPELLTRSFLDLLANDEERAALGQRALQVMRSQQGATQRSVAALLELLNPQSPIAELASEKRA